MLRIPYCLHNRLTDDAPAALYSHRILFFCFWYSFLLEAEWVQGLVRPEGLGKLKKKSLYWASNPRPSGLQHSELTNSKRLKHNVSVTGFRSCVQLRGGRHLFCWVLQIEQVQRFRLTLSNGPNKVDVSLPSPESRNRSSSRNVLLCSHLGFRATNKVHKPNNSVYYRPLSEPWIPCQLLI
jgi:hypothetical protein